MKQHIILFDGPDGCGKTNISAALSEKLGIPVFKNEFEWAHFGQTSAEEYFRVAITYQHPYALSLLKQTGMSVIFDRAHPSEWAYARAFGRSLHDDAVAESDRISAELGAKLIIPVRSDYSKVYDEYGVKEEHLVLLDGLYRQYANITQCDCLVLNVDDEDLGREMTEIMNFLESK